MLKRSLIAIRSVSWPAWLATVLAFAALCAAIAYWAMVLLAPQAPIAPGGAVQDTRALPQLHAASQLFGVTREQAAAAAPPSTIQVLGVVAAGWKGSAILAVDGKPPKMYAVGARLTPTQSLVAVRSDAVVVDTNGLVQELPAPTKPSLAVLTEGKARGAPGAPATTPPGAPPPSPTVGQSVIPPPAAVPAMTATPATGPSAPPLPGATPVVPDPGSNVAVPQALAKPEKD
jgi:general secretion pathway protein C